MQKVGQDLLFLVVAQNYWAKADSEKQAKINAEKIKGGKIIRYQVYLADPQAYVDQLGRIHYRQLVAVKEVDGKVESKIA